jgi:phenylalanyl-tRNA synthetase beta chain
MKVPFSWLKEFIPLTAEPAEVAERLTMRGLEVEGLEEILPAFDKVYVGEVIDIKTDPAAAALSFCTVNAGGESLLPVVCGAPNVEKGKKVAVAVSGARLTGNMVIESRQIRGTESQGMLCSEQELGLSDDHAGIMILPGYLNVGDRLEEALQIKDYVLDVNVPPNRGDCQSILGIAREVSSIFNQRLTLPTVNLREEGEMDGMIGLSILDPDACPRYVLKIIKNITIVPSPFWMRNRISKCGMRAINSIVDVTNYVMLELGQPLHAFDYERIADKRIEVRLAEEKSVFRTLDDTDRRLEKGDILICDGSGPVALAGVMGGQNSEISHETCHVALESAFFNPLLIRKTSRRLDIRSEASARFEKGIDIENVDYAAGRAIGLMQEISGGTVLRGSKEVHEKKPRKFISLNLKRASEVIGTPVEDAEAIGALNSVGISTETNGDNVLCSIPSFRHDIGEYFDLIEEVARIYGYDRIPATMPISRLLPVKPTGRDLCIATTKDYFTSAGFFEVINYGFFDQNDIEKFSIREPDERASCVPILNPISKELGVMRTFLGAGLLESLAYNLNRGTKNIRLFEVGKVFFLTADLPRESLHACCVMAGKEREYFWRDAFKEFDFFDLKGIIEGLWDRFGRSLQVATTKEPFLDPAKAADVLFEGTKIGWIGQISDEVAEAYEIKEKVLAADLSLNSIVEDGFPEKVYQPIPRYPAVTRDFSFIVDDSISVTTLTEKIKSISPLIVSVGIFDIFKKEVRSIAFRVVFQSFEDTLTDETISDVQQNIIDTLTKIEGIKLRT